MNSQELLEILGDVDERYVLAAEGNVVRPKFRWQPWAAAAACVALICAAAWPRVMPKPTKAGGVTADSSSADCAAPMEDEAADAMEDADAEEPAVKEIAGTLVQAPGLHDYFLFEGGRALMATAEGTAKAPGGGVDDAAAEDAPVPAPNAAPIAGDFEDAQADVPYDPESGTLFPYVEEAVDQDEATRQYQSLLQNAGINEADRRCPAWFGGMWLDNDWPDNVSRLTVAVAEDFYSEALTAQIGEWCGGTGNVQVCIVKYSYTRLSGLMDEISAVFDQYGWLPSTFGANVTANRIELDIFGMPGDELLADLARLDPDGDAIRVQVFTDRTIRVTDDAVMKPPAPGDEPSLALPD